MGKGLLMIFLRMFDPYRWVFPWHFLDESHDTINNLVCLMLPRPLIDTPLQLNVCHASPSWIDTRGELNASLEHSLLVSMWASSQFSFGLPHVISWTVIPWNFVNDIVLFQFVCWFFDFRQHPAHCVATVFVGHSAPKRARIPFWNIYGRTARLLPEFVKLVVGIWCVLFEWAMGHAIIWVWTIWNGVFLSVVWCF